MIAWGKHEKERIMSNGQPTTAFHFFQRSVTPPGYIINLVPHGELCHLQCMHIEKTSDGYLVVHIGTVQNIDARDAEAKRKAAASLRAACEDHAATAASQPA